MPNHLIDITGQKFNGLYVIERDIDDPRSAHEAMWKCRCDCGNIVTVSGSQLRSGNRKSCGCAYLKYQKQPEVFLNQEKGYGIAFFARESQNNWFTAFDIEDLDIIKSSNWQMTPRGYVLGYQRKTNNPELDENYSVVLHRAIMKKHGELVDENNMVDHANHNILDNRRSTNLSVCTGTENNFNRKYWLDTDDHERNISYNSSIKKFIVKFRINRVDHSFQFDTNEEAIAFRDNYIKEHPSLSKYYYYEDNDITASENYRPFNIEGDNEKLHPFYIVDGESMAPPNPEDVITPFKFINNNNQNDKGDKE